jgi:hypothetical protein
VDSHLFQCQPGKVVEAAGTFVLATIAIVHSGVAPSTHRQEAQCRVAKPDNSRASRTGWNSRITVHSSGGSAASSNILSLPRITEESKVYFERGRPIASTEWKVESSRQRKRSQQMGRDAIIFLREICACPFFDISTSSKYQRKKSRSKSKIATPKDPKVFRRGSSLRCAMKVGSLELGTL